MWVGMYAFTADTRNTTHCDTIDSNPTIVDSLAMYPSVSLLYGQLERTNSETSNCRASLLFNWENRNRKEASLFKSNIKFKNI